MHFVILFLFFALSSSNRKHLDLPQTAPKSPFWILEAVYQILKSEMTNYVFEEL